MASKKLVDEAKFVQDLETIIERDFYPDLDSLKTQKEYLDAVEHNDVAKLRQIQMKLQRPDSNMRESGSRFETPIASTSTSLKWVSNSDHSNPEPPKKRLSDELSLDQYLSTHTSEDDLALKQLMEDSERQKRIKKPWLYESSEVETNKAVNLLALPSPEQQALALDNKQANRDLVTWKHQAQSSAVFIPEGVPLSEKEKLELAARKPRSVLYENTRFKVSTTIGVNRSSTSSSVFANKLEGRIGVDGREVTSHNTPGVGGYKYVSTPSPAPGAMGESPFMTWGQLDSTPILVDPSATPLSAPSFKIPDIPEREQLAIDLAERVSKHNRAKKQTALKTAADSVRRYASPSQRIASMSPAAQKLFVSRIATGQSVGGAYTPSPLSSFAKSPRTPSAVTPLSVRKSVNADKSTPMRKSSGASPSPSTSAAGPKKASDFF